jgi:hypothetical protein
MGEQNGLSEELLEALAAVIDSRCAQLDRIESMVTRVEATISRIETLAAENGRPTFPHREIPDGSPEFCLCALCEGQREKMRRENGESPPSWPFRSTRGT